MPAKILTEKEKNDRLKIKLKERIKTYQKEIQQYQRKIQMLRKKSDECSEKISHLEFPSLF